MISTILIGYDILNIDIIIFETFYTKYNIFNLVNHSPYTLALIRSDSGASVFIIQMC